MKKMIKKSIIAIIVVLIIAGTVICGFWAWKVREGRMMRKILQNMQNQVQNPEIGNKGTDDSENNESIEFVDSGWKLYRNNKYSFELKYPEDWNLKIINVPDTESRLYFFKKDDYNYFAVFPTGGFGHGIEKPKVSYEKFKGKDAKMFRYGKYPFPNFIYIISELPKDWSSENYIEIAGAGENNIKILQEIYNSFQFTQ